MVDSPASGRLAALVARRTPFAATAASISPARRPTAARAAPGRAPRPRPACKAAAPKAGVALRVRPNAAVFASIRTQTPARVAQRARAARAADPLVLFSPVI